MVYGCSMTEFDAWRILKGNESADSTREAVRTMEQVTGRRFADDVDAWLAADERRYLRVKPIINREVARILKETGH